MNNKIGGNRILRHSNGALKATAAGLFAGALLLASGSMVGRTTIMSGIPEYTSPAPGGELERARSFMAEGNYGGAIDCLRSLIASGGNLTPALREECEYLLARSLYERGDEHCISLLEKFASDYPASAYTPGVRLLEADYYFFSHQFGPAARLYSELNTESMDAKSRELYAFRKGVSQTMSGEFDKARATFRRLEEHKSYRTKAKFYLAYIDYVNFDYASAYDGFRAVKDASAAQDERRNGKFRYFSDKYVPTGFEAEYFMAQIDYIEGRWQQAATLGEKMLTEKPIPELEGEMQRVVGESLFKLGDEGQAREYLQKYLSRCDRENTPAVASAIYSMGAILYADRDYEGAMRMMDKLTGNNDEISQSAWLYMGQILLHQNDASGAAVAFDKAYRQGYNRSVSETALYNYVAARTRGGNVPFSSAIPMMEDFLSAFPNSKYSSAVEQELATAYYNEKDYRKAMESIERIKHPGKQVLAAKQKVAYSLGTECAANSNWGEAEKYMQIAASMTQQDASTARQAQLWLGDALYAQGKYSQATSSYKKFLASEPKSANRTLGLYDLAYSLYMQKDYKQASHRFTEALESKPALPQSLRTDATIRRADCLYYCGDTQTAINSYSEAIDAGATDADYALLRRAMTRGSAGDARGKIADLELLMGRFPESKWMAQALLEKGIALTDLGDASSAAEAFEELSRRFPQSGEARRGWLNLAISRQTSGETEKSIEAYKELIRRWPTSEEAALAGEDLRKIYASRGDLASLSAWLKRVPGAPQLDDNEIERLAFDAAERLLNDRPDDTSALKKYIADYPDGKYLAQALYDLADVDYAAGNYASALRHAEELIAKRGDSRPATGALAMKGEIIEKYYPERKGEALEAWRLLLEKGGADQAEDAYAGIMRTTDDASEQLRYANKLLSAQSGLSAEASAEATLYKALALLKQGKAKEGERLLENLSTSPETEAGARAAVELGERQLKSGNAAAAERTLSAFTDAGTPHQYWLARGFIALADALHARGKTSLAREYVISLRDNYPGNESDIKSMIEKRVKAWKK